MPLTKSTEASQTKFTAIPECICMFARVKAFEEGQCVIPHPIEPIPQFLIIQNDECKKCGENFPPQMKNLENVHATEISEKLQKRNLKVRNEK